MNGFLQEYGLNIVAVIIVLAVIVFASVFGDTITGGINDITSDFFAKSGITADVNGGGGAGGGTGDNDENNNSQYQLSGTWVFNESLSNGDVDFTEDVDFTITENGYTTLCDCMVIDFYVIRDMPAVTYRYADDGTFYDFYYWPGWCSEDGKTVTFTSKQTVSPEFYEWFTANATKTGIGDVAGHVTPR